MGLKNYEFHSRCKSITVWRINTRDAPVSYLYVRLIISHHPWLLFSKNFHLSLCLCVCVCVNPDTCFTYYIQTHSLTFVLRAVFRSVDWLYMLFQNMLFRRCMDGGSDWWNSNACNRHQKEFNISRNKNSVTSCTSFGTTGEKWKVCIFSWSLSWCCFNLSLQPLLSF